MAHVRLLLAVLLLLVVLLPAWAVQAQPTTIRIDTGATTAYVDSQGQTWEADRGFVGGTPFVRASAVITGTADQQLYRTERFGMTAYQLPIANGPYTVRLLFAEANSNIDQPGERTFGVVVEGTNLGIIDIVRDAPGQRRAFIRTVEVTISDGQLDLSFTKGNDSTKIDAIEVLRREVVQPSTTTTTATTATTEPSASPTTATATTPVASPSPSPTTPTATSTTPVASPSPSPTTPAATSTTPVATSVTPSPAPTTPGPTTPPVAAPASNCIDGFGNQAYCVYMPFTVRSDAPPPPTPTPVTPTAPPTTAPTAPPATTVPTTAPAPSPALFNGDFEQGRVAWLEVASNNEPLIVSGQVNGFVVPVPARSGTWVAWLGGDDDLTTGLVQRVTIPASAPYLSYWYQTRSTDICADDIAGVSIDTTLTTGVGDAIVVDVMRLCSSNVTPTWQQRTIDLRTYVGRTVDLIFLAGTDATLVSSWFLDDIAFQAGASAAPPAPTAAPTTAPTPRPTTPSTPNFDRNGDGRVTCADFRTRAEARVALLAGYTNLDGDGDGIPCESLPPRARQASTENVQAVQLADRLRDALP